MQRKIICKHLAALNGSRKLAASRIKEGARPPGREVMHSRRQQHVFGSKIGKSHSSTTRLGKKLVETAHGLDQVTRIALCALSHQGKRGVKNICSLSTDTGLRIRVKSEGTIQDIRIVTNEPDDVLTTLARKFPILESDK